MILRPTFDWLEPKLVLSNISGQWTGTLTQPSGQGSSTSYDFEMNLTQSGNSVSGGEKISTGSYYADISLAGTINVTKNIFNFQESMITQQAAPPGYIWLIKSGSLQISASGGSMSGPWSSGGDGGQIDLTQTSSPLTTTTVTSESSPSVYGQMVTFTAIVTPLQSGGNLPTGTVQFTIDGSNYNGPVALDGSTASIGITTLSVAGSPHAVSATYTPDSDSFMTSSGTLDGGQTVTKATPTVHVSATTGTANGSPFAATATVAGVVPGVDSTPAASLERVSPTITYYSGNTPLSGAPSTAGTYTAVANFAGSADYTSASDMATVVIKQPVIPPTLLTPPSLTTDYGAVVALLLVESRNPESPGGYVETETLLGMNAMVATVHNRLKNPKLFNARGATTLSQIIGAPGQFAGFSTRRGGGVIITNSLQNLITQIFRSANMSGLYQAQYQQYIQDAETTANSYFDPFANVGGSYAWKTAGHKSPGGFFVKLSNGIIAGNQFYTIKLPNKKTH